MQKRTIFLFLCFIVSFLAISVNAHQKINAINSMSPTGSLFNAAAEPLLIWGPSQAEPGQIMAVTVQLNNLQAITHTFQLTNALPVASQFITGTATAGLVYDEGQHHLSWSGAVGPGEPGYTITAVSSPTYINLGDLPSPPANLCDQLGDCDEGTADFDLAAAGHSATLFGETLTTLHLSANGFIFGPDGVTGAACLACPQPLPNAAEPNQLIAGLWRDIDMDGGNGQWYAAVASGLLANPADEVLYVNWHNAGQFGNPFLTSRHAIAVVLDGQSEPAGRVYLLIDHISDAAALTEAGFSIGAENKEGHIGTVHAFSACSEAPCISHGVVGDVPANGTTLRLDPAIVPGPNGRQFSYQLQVTGNAGDVLTNRAAMSGTGFAGAETAVLQTHIGYYRFLPVIHR